jgi:hypothetical protein
MLHQQAKSRKPRDMLLYVLIGILVVASAWVFAVHEANTGGSPNLPLKWLGFGGMTAVVFGYAIRAGRREWRKRRFWLLLGAFGAVHLGLGVFVVTRAPVVPLLVYAVLTGPEYVLLAAYLEFFSPAT